ncbi:MAG: acyloxyacyl hydrolase [Flavobacteriales bacterium]
MIYSSRLGKLLLVVLCSWTTLSKAQVTVEAHALRGFLLPHRQNMLHLPDGPANAAELRIYKRTNGEKDWHKLYNLPEVGLTIRGFDLANHELLGYGLAFGPFFSSLILHSTRFSWNLEMACGIGLVSKPFDLETNYKNIAIGSYGNAFIMLGQRLNYRLTDYWGIHSSLSFNHMSNAAFAIPNLGLNYPMISIGVSRSFSPSNRIKTISKDSVASVSGYWDLALSFGIKETYNPRDVKYPTFNLSFQRCIGLTRKSSVAPGIDVFYNAALKPNFEISGDTVSPWQILQLGTRIGYQLNIDRLIVSLSMGVYLKDYYKQDGFLYHRAGLRYYFSEHWGANLSLKTHFFKADFFELGAAYRF